MYDGEGQWQARVDSLWIDAASMGPEELVRRADELAAERPPDDPAALFERASARDTAGWESESEPIYRAALASERLDPVRRARATIQLASTLRILGNLEESEQLLSAELDRGAAGAARPALQDELRAFLALTYIAQGRAVEAAAQALIALAPHLSRYNRSVLGNAEELLADSSASMTR